MTTRNWQNITDYMDTVGTTLKTFTFPKTQNFVSVTIRGNANVTYTIGSQSGTLTPGQSISVSEKITSFTLTAASGTQTVEVWATEDGTQKVEDDSSDSISGLAASMATKMNKNDIIYLSDYITNYNLVALIFYNCDSAFTNALAACKSGATLVIPVAQLFVSSTFQINNPLTVKGGVGSIIEQSGYCDLFQVNCDNVRFYNIEMEHTAYWNSANYATMASGDYTGIRFHTGRRHIVDKCTIIGFSANIHFENCDFFSVTNTYIIKNFNYGVLVENQGNPDSGDSIIHGNIFSGSPSSSYPTKALIKQRSGGGLKITDNKLLSGQIGIHISIASGIGTGVLIVEGNSVEGQTQNCLRMEYETGAINTSHFIRTIIEGNEFEGNLCTGDPIYLDGSIVPYSMKDVIFADNLVGDVPNTLNCVYVNGISDIKLHDNELIGGVVGILSQSYTYNITTHDNKITTAPTAIKHVGYAQLASNKNSNFQHKSVASFSNNSLTNYVNAYLCNFANQSAQASIKVIIDVAGSINTPAAEVFYGHYEFLLYSSSNGTNYTNGVLISSVAQGLPISVQYNNNGYFQIKRNDTYADQTYTITGNIKADVNGLCYVIGGNS